MNILHVRHRTVYRYHRPVGFGEHRLMCRPRDSHDLRLLDTGLTLSPPGTVRWLHDVFGNSIAIVDFKDRAAELLIESTFRAEHYPAAPHELRLEPYASVYPFSYPAEELPDIGRTIEPHYPDPQRKLAAWARVYGSGGQNTLDLLTRMTQAIKGQFGYQRREAVGTQTPLETLARKAGSCRDYAVFMMEAARSLGFAARFVSGYVYDEKLIDAGAGMVGGGETHAWVQIYLPGAGWVEFDPTNGLVGGRNLIRIAVARQASQAVPLSGTYIGAPQDYAGMEVKVEVSVE